MNYKESAIILKEIKKSKKILINCHRGPDSDSVGSALALYRVLKNLDKEVSVICPSDLPADLTFLTDSDLVKRVNFSTFNFTEYDLFLIIDSSTYAMVTGLKDSNTPTINSVVIDHHFSNEKFGDINLIDPDRTSTGELLFKIFEDWDVSVDKVIAECLLTGIIGDTGSFQYQNVGEETLRIAASLVEKGADKDKIIYNIYRNIDFKEVKMWGKFIESMMIEDNFVWSAISLATYKDFGEYPYAKEDVANLLFPIVKGTDFGIVMVETSDKVLSVSFRARSKFDVSKIAGEVGGGGHKAAAGARIEGLPFQDAVNKVLTTARKYAKKDH
jgi:bifunctional oligoribonuclease and PAP phosphatase NrnA